MCKLSVCDQNVIFHIQTPSLDLFVILREKVLKACRKQGRTVQSRPRSGISPPGSGWTCLLTFRLSSAETITEWWRPLQLKITLLLLWDFTNQSNQLNNKVFTSLVKHISKVTWLRCLLNNPSLTITSTTPACVVSLSILNSHLTAIQRSLLEVSSSGF